LHVLEHIGLGRYGDPLDPQGSVLAARELARVLAPGGRLYVSVPTGVGRTCFNAHRVFSPAALKGMFAGLVLESFALVDDGGSFAAESPTAAADQLAYGCGMYVFRRD
jgi:SAM-dependent methyltransferase